MDPNAVDNALKSLDLQDLFINHPFLVAIYFLLFLFGILIFITACRVLRYFSNMIQESAYFKRIEMTQRRLHAQHLKHLAMSRAMMLKAKKQNDERTTARFSNTNDALCRLDQMYIKFLTELEKTGIDGDLVELRKATLADLYKATIAEIRSNKEDLSSLDVVGHFAEKKIAQMTKTFESMQKGATYR